MKYSHPNLSRLGRRERQVATDRYPIPHGFLTLAGLLLCFVQASFAAPPNLVTNPGFEQGITGWNAVGASIQVVAPGFAGNSAMRSFNRTATWQGVQQSLLGTMDPGHNYECSAWVRTSSATASSVKMTFEIRDALNPTTSSFRAGASVSAGDQWVQMRALFSFDAVPPITVLKFKFEGPAAGTDIFVDEVVVREAEYPAPENVIANPDFASGTVGWLGEGAASLSTTTGRAGGLAGLATSRGSSADGLSQSIAGGVRAGKSYFCSAWVRTNSAAVETATLHLVATVGGITTTTPIASGPVNQAGWRWLSGYFTLPPGGVPSAARIVLAGPAAGVSLSADDVFVAEATGLRWAARNFPAIRIGAAPSASVVGAAGARDALLAAQFQVVSPENVLKFSVTEPSQGAQAWSGADKYLRFATAHGGGSRGHTFTWHSSVPSWVDAPNRTPAVLQSILWAHIDPLAVGFSGRVLRWDVVNEAISDSGGALRSSPWYNAPGIGYAAEGDRYIRECFIRARAADPITPLVYNDYSVEPVNTKSTAMHNMLAAFKAASVPIDGVGLQTHLSGPSIPSYTSIADNLERLQNLGLDVEITEFDIRLPVDGSGNATGANLDTQADIAFHVLGTALAFPKFVGFQVWNLTDADSWIPGAFPGQGAATLFDQSADKKPAFWGIWNALAGQAEKLPVVLASGGTTTVTSGDKTARGGGVLQFSGTGAGSFVTVRVEVPFAGQWNVEAGQRRTVGSGQYQLAVAPEGGAFVDVGATQDGYGTTDTIRDLGAATFASPGRYDFRFTATGKNGASSGYELLLDYLRITPISCAPTVEPPTDISIPLGGTVPSMRVFAEDDKAHGTLAVTATSSNQALVPAANVQIVGYSPFFTLTATPIANTAGVTTITVSANDGTATTQRTFLLRVGTLREEWRQINFGSPANSGAGADNADPDRDGISNRLEYDLVSPPLSPSSADLPMIASSPAGNTFTFRRRFPTTGSIYIVQESETLASWVPASGTSEVLGVSGNVETVRITFPPANTTRKFYRLQITQGP